MITLAGPKDVLPAKPHDSMATAKLRRAWRTAPRNTPLTTHPLNQTGKRIVHDPFLKESSRSRSKLGALLLAGLERHPYAPEVIFRSLPAVGILVTLLLVGGCDSVDSTSTKASEPAQPAVAKEPAASPDHSKSKRARHERPLPAFSGISTDGRLISISDFIGRRLVLFFFNPEVPESKSVAQAVASVASERRDHNFEVIGIAIGSDISTTRKFAEETGLDFSVVDDSRGQITRKLQLRTPVAVLGVDAEGYVSDLSLSSFEKGDGDAWKLTADRIRQGLHMPTKHEAIPGALDQRPLAPLFETPFLDGGEPFRLADTRGKPLVLIFFLHTCPHCHAALEFFKKHLQEIPEAKRPALIGISLNASASRAVVHSRLDELELDFFPILIDPPGKVGEQFGVFGGVPIVYLIDREGRIVQRVQGWREGRTTALLRMQLARIAGTKIPMLLNPQGYTGNDVCGVCHTIEHESWQYTNHSAAYSTLVEHAKERDTECVGCHVVGFEKPGGFSIREHPEYLENVGCESCHGRGGPHLSPQFAKDGGYEPVCITCHNPKHSLGFEYATFLPKVSHSSVAALSAKERTQLVDSRKQPRDVLPKNASFVGSDACQSCHSSEYQTWAQSPHGHAVATLQKAGKADDANCLRCHTTGYDRSGGFPAAGNVRNHADLARVGCESCHGPGGDHVAPGANRTGTIVSLGDKCDSCVILQICGSCHDDANDPGFEFEVEEKIERQRHGTIEPGAGPGLDTTTGPVPLDAIHADFLSRLGSIAISPAGS